MNFCVANISRSPSNLYWDDPSGAEYYLMIQESINKNASSKNYYCKLLLFNKSNIQIIILDQTRTSWISGARHKLFKPSQVRGHVLQTIPTSSISLAKLQIHGSESNPRRQKMEDFLAVWVLCLEWWVTNRAVTSGKSFRTAIRGTLLWENRTHRSTQAGAKFQGLAGGDATNSLILTY